MWWEDGTRHSQAGFLVGKAGRGWSFPLVPVFEALQEDVVLQKLGEHMQIALMPVVLPTAEDFVAGTGALKCHCR